MITLDLSVEWLDIYRLDKISLAAVRMDSCERLPPVVPNRTLLLVRAGGRPN